MKRALLRCKMERRAKRSFTTRQSEESTAKSKNVSQRNSSPLTHMARSLVPNLVRCGRPSPSSCLSPPRSRVATSYAPLRRGHGCPHAPRPASPTLMPIVFIVPSSNSLARRSLLPLPRSSSYMPSDACHDVSPPYSSATRRANPTQPFERRWKKGLQPLHGEMWRHSVRLRLFLRKGSATQFSFHPEHVFCGLFQLPTHGLDRELI